MRKTVYLSIFLAFLVLSGHRTYGQTQTCPLQVSDAVGREGDTIVVAVTLTDAPNQVEAFGFDLSFDERVLHYTGTYSRGPLVESWSFFDVSTPAPGRLRVGGFTVPQRIAAGQSGTLVELEFHVVCNDCNAGEVSELIPSDLVDDMAAWSFCSGAFRFLDCVSGEGLTVGSASGLLDSRITIPVTIAAPQGAFNPVASLGFDLVYDPRVLHYTGSYTRGAGVANWPFFGVSAPTPGRLRVGGFTIHDAIAAGHSGMLVQLEFQVICADCLIGDSSPLFLDTLVDDIAGWPACSGAYVSGCTQVGDADESGTVTPQDALLAFEHFLRLTTLTGCQQAQADVDGDGEVSPVDAMQIFKDFVGL
jgi:hypothetical protein